MMVVVQELSLQANVLGKVQGKKGQELKREAAGTTETRTHQ